MGKNDHNVRHDTILGKILTLLIPLILTGSICMWPDTDTRRQLFDFGWKFTLGDPQDACSPDYDDSAWRTLDLPHDWSIERNISPTDTPPSSTTLPPTSISADGMSCRRPATGSHSN